MLLAQKAELPYQMPRILASALGALRLHGDNFAFDLVNNDPKLLQGIPKQNIGPVEYTVAAPGWWKGEHGPSTDMALLTVTSRAEASAVGRGIRQRR